MLDGGTVGESHSLRLQQTWTEVENDLLRLDPDDAPGLGRAGNLGSEGTEKRGRHQGVKVTLSIQGHGHLAERLLIPFPGPYTN